MIYSASTANSPVLRADGLLIGYGQKAILPSMSFILLPGQLTSIVGHQGAGKSTLLRTLLGLQPPVGGSLTMREDSRVGYVPARDAIDSTYPVRVEELVETGRYGFKSLGAPLAQADRERVWASLEATHAMSMGDMLFRSLSLLEKQQVLLARALCSDPLLLALDEPTASMDEAEANFIIDLILSLAKKRTMAIVMANHFIGLAARASDQVIFLDRDHSKALIGTPGEVFRSSKGTYFTKATQED